LGVRDSGFGLLAGLLLMLPSYVFGGMGAGDVKLMASIGAVVGINQVLDVVFYSYMTMFVMALFFIVVKGDLLKLLRRLRTLIYGLFAGVLAYQKPDTSDAASCRLPLAPAIALATCYVLYPALCNSGLMANLCLY
jgi:prepilin peptidase CpaA